MHMHALVVCFAEQNRANRAPKRIGMRYNRDPPKGEPNSCSHSKNLLRCDSDKQVSNHASRTSECNNHTANQLYLHAFLSFTLVWVRWSFSLFSGFCTGAETRAVVETRGGANRGKPGVYQTMLGYMNYSINLPEVHRGPLAPETRQIV